jgi:hypothetical protein
MIPFGMHKVNPSKKMIVVLQEEIVALKSDKGFSILKK